MVIETSHPSSYYHASLLLLLMLSPFTLVHLLHTRTRALIQDTTSLVLFFPTFPLTLFPLFLTLPPDLDRCIVN